MRTLLAASFGALALAMTGCGDDAVERSSPFSSSVQSVVFEVDYQPGAEPYTFSLLTGGTSFRLFRSNVEAAYAGLNPQIQIPTSLDEMEMLPASERQGYDVGALLEIAETHRSIRDGQNLRAFYVVFVDGFYEAEGVRDEQVIGVSIGDTGVIAMFKPVYDAQFGASLVEQTTLIHEFGHAVGLVNRGLVLTTPHHDAEHGAHCTNTECVMYWQNEGLVDILNFIQQFVFGDEDVVFGPECLADIEAEITRNQ
jgi:predicted Zn-dependent protease